MKHRQLSVAILTAALALVVLAGCGDSANPLHAVRSAAKNTLALTAVANGCDLGVGGTPSTILGRGQFSFPNGLGYEALQLPARGARAAGTAYLVFLPKRLWIKPVVSTALPKGDLWISAKFDSPRSAASTTPSLALLAQSMNPQPLPQPHPPAPRH